MLRVALYSTIEARHLDAYPNRFRYPKDDRSDLLSPWWFTMRSVFSIAGSFGSGVPRRSCVALRGFSLRGFSDVRGFPFCGGKKGLRLPVAVGKRV